MIANGEIENVQSDRFLQAHLTEIKHRSKKLLFELFL